MRAGAPRAWMRLKRNSYRTGRGAAPTRLPRVSALPSCRHVVASACPRLWGTKPTPATTPAPIAGSGFHEPQYPCRPNLRLIHRTVSKVMTPIDKKSTTGPNIIDHKVELPTIKACPTVFQLPEWTLSQIGNPISQRTEMTAPIFCHLFVTEAGTPVTTDQWRGHSHEIFGLQAFAGDCRRPMREYRGPAPPARSNRVPRRP
jgi:hypothetical protein